MKTITLNLYTIKELDQDARQKAFDDNRFFNVDDNFWYESVLDDFCEVFRIVGVDLRPDDTSFSGFTPQGDGSAFESTIDVPMRWAAKAEGEKSDVFKELHHGADT